MRNDFLKKTIAIDPIISTQESKKTLDHKPKKQKKVIDHIDIKTSQSLKLHSLTKCLRGIFQYQDVLENFLEIIYDSLYISLIPIRNPSFPRQVFAKRREEIFKNSFFAGFDKPKYNQSLFLDIREFDVDNKNKITMYTFDFSNQKIYVPSIESIPYSQKYTTIQKDEYGNHTKQENFKYYDDGKICAHYHALTYNLEVSNIITLGTWLSLMPDRNAIDYELTSDNDIFFFKALDNEHYVKSLDFPIVKNLSWLDIIEFCNRLSISQGLKPCYDISKESNKIALLSIGSHLSNQFNLVNHIPNYINVDLLANGYRLPTIIELAMIDTFLYDMDQNASILEHNPIHKKLFSTHTHNTNLDLLKEFTNDFSVCEQIDHYLKAGWFHHKELALQELGLTNQNTLYDFFYYQWDVLGNPFLNSINKKLRDEVGDAYFKEVQDKNSRTNEYLKGIANRYEEIESLLSFKNKKKAYNMKFTNYNVLAYKRKRIKNLNTIEKNNFFGHIMSNCFSPKSDNYQINELIYPANITGFRVVRTIK